MTTAAPHSQSVMRQTQAVIGIVILGLYLLIARRQPNVAAQMKALEEQLDRAEKEAGQK